MLGSHLQIGVFIIYQILIFRISNRNSFDAMRYIYVKAANIQYLTKKGNKRYRDDANIYLSNKTSIENQNLHKSLNKKRHEDDNIPPEPLKLTNNFILSTKYAVYASYAKKSMFSNHALKAKHTKKLKQLNNNIYEIINNSNNFTEENDNCEIFTTNYAVYASFSIYAHNAVEANCAMLAQETNAVCVLFTTDAEDIFLNYYNSYQRILYYIKSLSVFKNASEIDIQAGCSEMCDFKNKSDKTDINKIYRTTGSKYIPVDIKTFYLEINSNNKNKHHTSYNQNDTQFLKSLNNTTITKFVKKILRTPADKFYLYGNTDRKNKIVKFYEQIYSYIYMNIFDIENLYLTIDILRTKRLDIKKYVKQLDEKDIQDLFNNFANNIEKNIRIDYYYETFKKYYNSYCLSIDKFYVFFSLVYKNKIPGVKNMKRVGVRPRIKSLNFFLNNVANLILKSQHCLTNDFILQIKNIHEYAGGIRYILELMVQKEEFCYYTITIEKMLNNDCHNVFFQSLINEAWLKREYKQEFYSHRTRHFIRFLCIGLNGFFEKI